MPQEIQIKLIEEEMKSNYIDYAMSVITARAIPDARDGLKPVHRRVLYSMYGMGLTNNKPFTKCARIVGDCFKYHPHGDVAIYDTLVRMAQDFSLRHPLIQGHGNFGSIDFSNPAQMRYTEARLSKIGEELLVDIDKETVNFAPNFDGSLKEPLVLPSKIPNLLINGSSGIAVGMATNIPPHNLTEVSEGVIALIDNPNITILDLMQIIKGPDFPTAGIICGSHGIKEAYKTGRGKIVVRAKADVSEKRIIITEIPYQVNKSLLIENIADLVRDKKVEGISGIRDESSREGMRVVIEVKNGYNSEIVLNQLYKHSSLQNTFGIIMLALKDNEPKVFNLKELIESFLQHRKEVVTRRTAFDLRKAEERAHVLEGLKIALNNIDEVVVLLKQSLDIEKARNGLINIYNLTKIQADAILEMKLSKLISLEQEKINKEHNELLVFISKMKEILGSGKIILDIIKEELIEIKNKYGDKRKSQIIEDYSEAGTEELIEEENDVITLTHSGYIKRMSLELYKQQKRGGKGVIAATTKEEDFVKSIFVASNHSMLLFFTNQGKVHWLNAYQIPEATRYAKGGAVVNLLNLDKDEIVNTVIPVKKFSSDKYLFMCTKNGIVKRTGLDEFSNPRKGGIIAINLKDKDELINVVLTNGGFEILISTKNGNAVRFNESDISVIGRSGMGVRGVKLKDDSVVSCEICDGKYVLCVTENGYGKRTDLDEYRVISRGGSGVINIITDERNGNVAGVKLVNDNDELIFITRNGIVIRMNVNDISSVGRNTKGVRIMKLDERDKVVGLTKVAKEEVKDFTLGGY